MNPNPHAKRILCFGDSNTWGRSGKNVDRYPSNVRWTGLLQSRLGEEFEIIEEGLRSRTTNLDDDDPNFPFRSGLEYFYPCLGSHQPLDLIVLWIGTNDLKTKFNREAKLVASSVKRLVEVVKLMSKDPQGQSSEILLIAPPWVREEVLKPHTQFTGAGEKSKQLEPLYRQLAEEEQTHFLDMTQYVQAGEYDGIHLEPDMHPIVAEKMYREVIKILGKEFHEN